MVSAVCRIIFILKKHHSALILTPALCDLTAISASSGGCFSFVNKADDLLAVRPAALLMSCFIQSALTGFQKTQ